MLVFLVLAIYMIVFILSEWNHHTVTSNDAHYLISEDAAERSSLL